MELTSTISEEVTFYHKIAIAFHQHCYVVKRHVKVLKCVELEETRIHIMTSWVIFNIYSDNAFTIIMIREVYMTEHVWILST